jgi:RNA polymerase sigma-70 factor (ECF subfamily)
MSDRSEGAGEASPEAARRRWGVEADDAALVAAVLGGERAAFDVIVERHQRAVYHVCYRFTNNQADASDLVQDVFVRAYRGLARYKGQAALGTWLYRIAVNVCLNKVSARRVTLEPLDDNPIVDTGLERPDEPLMRSDRDRQLKAAIARLPKKQRATVILRVYHELPHEEIARLLGSSVGAVKANFFHALNSLRRLLTEGALR